ncbi:hypothetical protein ASPWEDRAFT_122188 [Aspergillus wentii DTO 134E9]|uniref:Protein HRI1 n=1 Tax=Aspergillus wentii DTO 134E9 TaxID=1073089 RepID=A0A1L9R548_ASPWE|nr:uncharacterized protein ASPWEDRAFT_122188 [Aspergillus wentii DTO 134E9]OJJ30007.1 hypothetical protein ASPWEDRAFT_122188 [Aspergillus wentii DTO 134E9]
MADKIQSDASLSTRISLRWQPDPPFEYTDTVVMSVQGWYLDLRVEKETGKIDWAIAGKRIVESEETRRVRFTHDLDSHNCFSTADCGTFTTLPNGDDLETGSMPRPDLPDTPMTEYEEVWRELVFREGPEGPGKGLCWVLESEGEKEVLGTNTVGETKIFMARIWGTFLAFRQRLFHALQAELAGENGVRLKEGKEVSVRREEWDPKEGWQVKYAIGEEADSLPSMVKGLQGKSEDTWKGRKNVMVDGQRYVLRAFEEID